MHVHLDARPGFLVPPDCYVSLRIGSEKRHGRFAPAQTHAFPYSSEQQQCRLEVFQRIGSCSVSLDPNVPTGQEGILQCEKAGLDLRYHVTLSSSRSELVKQVPQRQQHLLQQPLPLLSATQLKLDRQARQSSCGSLPSIEEAGLPMKLSTMSRSQLLPVFDKQNLGPKAHACMDAENLTPHCLRQAEEQGMAFLKKLQTEAALSKDSWRPADQGLCIPAVSSTGPVETISTPLDAAVDRAARWLMSARAILIGTGAGMGVDCGLGTYRGRNAGVWPPLETLDLDYADICTPSMLQKDPQLTWAFWRHCHQAYYSAMPHEGYHIIQRWSERAPMGAFCYTTNVDALWPRVLAEERVYEAHGSTMYLQCSERSEDCQSRNVVWPCPKDLANRVPLQAGCIDRVEGDAVPRCPSCNAVARPNVLMFGDFDFCKRRSHQQNKRYKKWLQEVEADTLSAQSARNAQESPIVCLEIGAGRAVPTVRTMLEGRASPATNRSAAQSRYRLIRVNLEDSDLPEGLAGADRGVAIPLSAMKALSLIDARMRELEGVHLSESHGSTIQSVD